MIRLKKAVDRFLLFATAAVVVAFMVTSVQRVERSAASLYGEERRSQVELSETKESYKLVLPNGEFKISKSLTGKTAQRIKSILNSVPPFVIFS